MLTTNNGLSFIAMDAHPQRPAPAIEIKRSAVWNSKARHDAAMITHAVPSHLIVSRKLVTLIILQQSEATRSAAIKLTVIFKNVTD